ncbi:phenylalanine--tRNA ligase subunit beta [Siphonobacter sp. BAB-5405]|uniref:phenylalanine--tRNA ligase subunit beta n=1 Tax=Siphonobacter sp. BAB-5405 TaxID=1864825 RepID=UPI000C809128|nr:phenylalanine--tRNA ligase subunit beta [Siphonobacter sp. BAB-5405]PMD97136.1 phenylalanine--tRNA ligase subunit beta [Siphonobacter sp. BAB-5405]
MNISLNWLKQYISLTESPEELDQLLTGCGLEVEEIERIDSVPGGLQGVVIGEVLTCEPFTVKEKQLHLTTVDIGTGEPTTIVCGAANVAAGQRVVVATVGATIYPTNGEPFTIGKRKVYGHPSEGMICAEDELGLGTSHAGIMVLTTDLPNGTPAATYFKLEPDYRIVIGLTPNRADAASHIGVARDLKALLHRDIKLPFADNFYAANNQHPIDVVVENTEACPRFCGVTIDGVKVAESPDWLKQSLLAIGLRPINNIVDITNFICHELGQPMHAYDWHELAGQKIVVKTMPEGTKFVTLDGIERTLSSEDLMICDAEKPVGIAGVFGGQESGIKETTTRVFLEVAYFSPDWVRKSSMRHGLKTDASFRFERGTDPNFKLYTLKRAALLMQELAGGKITSEITDTHPAQFKPAQVLMSYRNIDRLIGQKIPHEQIHQILTDLDIKVWNGTEEGFTASIPAYRVDVTREADVIEEILRIYGLNNIGLSANLRTDYLAKFPEPSKDRERVPFKISQLLAGAGFQEIFTNSLTKPAYAASIKDSLPGEDVEILNKLSEDLGVMRQSMLFSGLEALAHNVNRRQRDLKFFEFGKTYHKMQPHQYVEKPHLALYLTGNIVSESWQQKSRPVAFHDLVSTVNRIFKKMGVKGLTTQEVETGNVWAYGLQYLKGKQVLATIGLVRSDLTKLTDLKQAVFFADLDWAALLDHYTTEVTFQEISKFPEVRRDLSLVLDKTISFKQIQEVAFKYEKNLLQSLNVFDIYEGPNLGEGKKSYSVSFTLLDASQTLTDSQIDKTMNRLMLGFEKELEAVIRK